MLGSFDGESLSVSEAGRFVNAPANLGVVSYWDFCRLFNDITTIIAATQSKVDVASVGVDSFGGTPCFVDRCGRLLENPHFPRDPNMQQYLDEAAKLLPIEMVNNAMGVDMRGEYRQLLKLRYLTAFRKGFASEIDKLLFLPSCIGYYLSGAVYAEFSYVASLQWCHTGKPDWNTDLLSLAGIRAEILPPIVASGTCVGKLTDSIRTGNNLKPANMITVTEHDTGSAMSLLTAETDDCVYLNQGTMSVISVPVTKPALSANALENHLSIEASFGDQLRLTRNLAGLMLIQKCRAVWNRTGTTQSFDELDAAGCKAASRQYLFRVDDPALRLTEDAPSLIGELCGAKLTPGETVRAVYDSLAETYLETIRLMEHETGKRYRKIRVLGGGCRSPLLCQIIANTCGIPVEAGPVEGSAIGNICVQLIASGEVKNMQEAVQAMQKSESLVCYTPR